jgi:hypothetical protein
MGFPNTIFISFTNTLITSTMTSFIFFTDVVVQFTSIASAAIEGSGDTSVQLSAVGERAIPVTVRYAMYKLYNSFSTI